MTKKKQPKVKSNSTTVPALLDTTGAEVSLRPPKKKVDWEIIIATLGFTVIALGSIVGTIVFATTYPAEIDAAELAEFTTADLSTLDTDRLRGEAKTQNPRSMVALMEATKVAEEEGFLPNQSRVWQSPTAHYISFTSEKGGEMECIIEDTVTCEITTPE